MATNLKKAILLLVKNAKRPLMRTQIVKLLYLADHEAFRLKGLTITGVHYIKDLHGPNSSSIVNATFSMQGHELAIVRRTTLIGQDYYLHVPGPEPRFSADLDAGDAGILMYVLGTYGELSLEDLKQAAYSTKPFMELEDKPLGSRVKFGSLRKPKILHPEELSKARLTAARGKGHGTREDQAATALQVQADMGKCRRAANVVMIGDS